MMVKTAIRKGGIILANRGDALTAIYLNIWHHLNFYDIYLIGVGKGLPSPPSEPCMRFSRTRLSSRWFPHRDWRANR
jgi:hypothetical protein